jgi:hypothetical protein
MSNSNKTKEVKMNNQTAEIKAKLLKEYSHLEQLKGSKYRGRVLAARNIRTELKKKFPGCKFKVTSESFSMGNAVDVSWFEGPTKKAVYLIINKYKDGDYNSMEEIYENKDNSFGDLFGSTKWVEASREISIERKLEAAAQLNIEVDEYGNPRGAIFVQRDWIALTTEQSFYVAPSKKRGK